METPTIGSANISKDEFLKLFVAQLQNQSPMDPLKGHEFIAQLAQFSSVEQLTSLNSSFEDTLKFQQLTGGSEFIGKKATFFNRASGGLDEGVIQGANTDGNTISVVIGNSNIPLSDVTGIYEDNNSSVFDMFESQQLQDGSEYIGKSVTYFNENTGDLDGGKIENVISQGGNVISVVIEGANIPISNVKGINKSSNSSNEDMFKSQQLSEGSEFIGKKAKYFNENTGVLEEGVIKGTIIDGNTISVVIGNKNIPLSEIMGMFENN